MKNCWKFSKFHMISGKIKLRIIFHIAFSYRIALVHEGSICLGCR